MAKLTMEINKEKIIRRLKTKKSNKELVLADEIYRYFDKKLPFPRIMRMIKEKGWQAIYEVFNELRKTDARNKLSLFIWIVKNIKIKWDDKDKF